ncbi:hypothetical protein E1B28_005189 [Marasmius oreades]|uniref:Uncharacterized protein n=1 Tax=Marasmius oreades TaxID=181124 RepID=A0A9P7V090_9AGAR|nr:uncharacterized protein E1B28_005189 [Marasmius oreades]KAG7097878.1 hypothetical protein E1B28_005189 [Marasmius oreades]
MQLFGINRSSVPLLIFYGELVPIAHFWDRLGAFGRGYVLTLACRIWYCSPTTVWIDSEQGTLIRGLEGPNHYLGDADAFNHNVVKSLPSSVELLDEDVCFRYFSQFPLGKGFDRDAIDIIHSMSERGAAGSPVINRPRPHVLSSKTDSLITVGSIVWENYGCFGDQVVMTDGRTRFTLTDSDKDPRLHLCSDVDQNSWMSQASSVFHRLGISLDDDLSPYKFAVPVIRLTASIGNSQQRSEDQPIYFFLHPVPEHGVPTHTWSYDADGKTSIPYHHCEYLGLPTELSMNRFTWTCWPQSETYKSIHKWQVARGFDPTTTEFARYLEYSIFEVQPESVSSQIEELDPSEASSSSIVENPRKNDPGQSAVSSIWSAITAPLTYAADEDSKISAALM